jgi:ABC-type glycerol-3-phosphate transport system permease component
MAAESIEELMHKQGLADLLKFSLIIVASVPVLMLYPFIQRYFVKGVMLGAIKG